MAEPKHLPDSNSGPVHFSETNSNLWPRVSAPNAVAAIVACPWRNGSPQSPPLLLPCHSPVDGMTPAEWMLAQLWLCKLATVLARWAQLANSRLATNRWPSTRPDGARALASHLSLPLVPMRDAEPRFAKAPKLSRGQTVVAPATIWIGTSENEFELVKGLSSELAN